MANCNRNPDGSCGCWWNRKDEQGLIRNKETTQADTRIAELEAELAATKNEVKRAYEQGRKDAIPEGWQLVPEEPTREMVKYGASKLGALYGHFGSEQCYKAMLATAPEVKP